jgi:acetylornithine deacetylase/succinyl-diaminopimelate desuccinylase family protein
MTLADRVLGVVDEMQGEIVELEQALNRIPSVTGDYGAISKYLRAYLEGMGFECDFIGKDGKPNVVGRLRGTTGTPRLALISHQDTVPAGPGWTVDPFGGDFRDGRIYGRGATDPNASNVVYLAAARALGKAGVRLKGDLVEAFTVDEEIGGADGSGYLTEGNHVDVDMAIAEGRNNVIWRGYSGHMRFLIVSKGKAAHGNAPWLGDNAISRMMAVMNGLERYQEELAQQRSGTAGLSYTTLLVGRINGGVAPNVVPDRCEISLDVRVIPEHDVNDVEARIREIIARVEATSPQYPFEIQQQLKARSTVVPEDHVLVRSLQRSIKRVRGQEVPVVVYHAAGDARFYMYRGIPAICYGAGDSAKNKIHGADEFVEASDLVEGTKALALAVMDLLGVEG